MVSHPLTSLSRVLACQVHPVPQWGRERASRQLCLQKLYMVLCTFALRARRIFLNQGKQENTLNLYLSVATMMNVLKTRENEGNQSGFIAFSYWLIYIFGSFFFFLNKNGEIVHRSHVKNIPGSSVTEKGRSSTIEKAARHFMTLKAEFTY